MKLLSIANAKSIWLFPTNDLSPTGKFYGEMLKGLHERYKFQVMPTIAQIAEFMTKKEAVPFDLGNFESSSGAVGITLTYYADGLMAETRGGTHIGDEFLSDLLKWLKDTYETTDERQLKIRRIYSSEIFVSLDNGLSLLNPDLQNFAGSYAAKARWPNPSQRVEVTGITFGADPVSKSQLPPFRLERDVSAAFEDARYFSAAPLQTRDHLALVQQLEAVLHL